MALSHCNTPEIVSLPMRTLSNQQSTHQTMKDSLDDHEEDGLLQTEDSWSEPKQSQRHLYAIVYLFCLILTNSVTALVVFRSCSGGSYERSDHTSHLPHRPLYDDLDQTSIQAVNFSAFSIGHSAYTTPASTQVDEAWRALGVECTLP